MNSGTTFQVVGKYALKSSHLFGPHSMLAEKLNMTPEEAERWIVNLIRNARLDAKIDSKLVGFQMSSCVCVCV